MSAVIVSVCVITYNHCNYIRQCLDGILMQQTNFPFEVIVNDDCSTDGTAEIVKEYESKHPQLFKVTYQTENQYSKGVRGMFPRFCFPRARGKYIALCEGDDYWTDPLKLQKQVDFLEKNPDYVLCTHYYSQFIQEESRFGLDLPYNLEGVVSFSLSDYVAYRNWCTQPLTSVFRKDAVDVHSLYQYKNFKDMTLFYLILKHGKGYLHQDLMGTYRLQSSGIWSSVPRYNQIADDLKTIKGIYDIEKSQCAIDFLYNFLHQSAYLGLTFYRKYCTLYLSVIFLIARYKGVLQALSLVWRTMYFRTK